MTTLGVRNNNPGNIDNDPKSTWLGQTGTNGRFCVFDTPEHGIRALADLLLIYQRKHGDKTVRQIITRWAPGNENNTAAYIAAVAGQMHITPDVELVLKSSPALLASMVCAIIHHENGEQPYPLSVINAGVALALQT